MFIAAACDERIEAPPQLLKNPPPQESASRPTTQELLEGPRKTIALATLPLTARVPTGWAVKNVEGTSVVLLEGPTPGGDAAIQLNERAASDASKLDILVNGAKREMAQHPESIKMVDLRDIAGAKLLERQRVGKVTNPTLSEPGVKESPPFTWTISIFVPRGDKYETYELNFIGLTADQYETDKPLLRGIIDSITVNGAATTESVERH
jgi:hypothetical protein